MVTRTYLLLERMLTTGDVNEELCQSYPELNSVSLGIQLKMFLASYKINSVQLALSSFKLKVPEVRRLFADVEQLLRLMLFSTVSSCAAERSFSSWRRLKTCLRTTMTQERRNAVVVCHVNKNILDNVDINEMSAEFAKRSDIRRVLFGSFDSWNFLRYLLYVYESLKKDFIGSKQHKFVHLKWQFS